jgi:cytochrome P450
MQRSESLWGRERTGFAANEFHPERFSPENLALFHLTSKDLETFAFGSGPRVCIGAYLARAEAREMILKFFGSFHTGVLDGGIAMSPTNQALISPIKIPVY